MTKPTLSAIRRLRDASDEDALAALIPLATLSEAERQATTELAQGWIRTIRAETRRIGGVSDFLQEFSLGTEEGIALLCVAEALLRIPDAATADALIKDKLAAISWLNHEKRTGTLFASASVYGLMLSGRVLKDPPTSLLGGLVRKMGEPLIRRAVQKAMGLLGAQFVLGRTIEEALETAAPHERMGTRFSYDMLGEGARTQEDADYYFKSYQMAIAAIGDHQEEPTSDALDPWSALWGRAGISVKLSALHPRYAESQQDVCFPVLVERLTDLCERAASVGISLIVDAEECDRLELSLDIIETVLQSPVTLDWPGLAMAVQAYQKRAPAVIAHIIDMCRTHGRQMGIRLVKGAYWDSEIKRAQMAGLSDYPVYTRKSATDVSYLACAKLLLDARPLIYPAFGTHNARSIAAIMTLAGGDRNGFEFQRLQGMGDALHEEVQKLGYPSRVYAPVGSHRDLLAYLVRRLLENGANTSFVQQVQDTNIPVAALLHDPLDDLLTRQEKRNPHIPLPPDLFASAGRVNSKGMDLAARDVFGPLLADLGLQNQWAAAPLVAGVDDRSGPTAASYNPADTASKIGESWDATAATVDRALALAERAQPAWAAQGASYRADVIARAADFLESHRIELMALLIREAGRTVKNAQAEVREAVDLCRYYAVSARADLATPLELKSYTGERNLLTYAPRGIIAAISPWNFPLAIFVGQIAAALLAGNAVMAKPAEQTPLIAYRAIKILHEAGVPPEVLALLTGKGEVIGAQLVKDPRVAGVVFTGSTAVGKDIAQTLAGRAGPLVPLIAETGGLNAMIVDSTALPEQVTDDVLLSAFDSAGQRCSSLRVLFVQDDVADRMLDMISGAMDSLRVGDPLRLSTDCGPLIDAPAKHAILEHIARMTDEGTLLAKAPLPADMAERGHFVAPHLMEIARMNQLAREAFGPVLHVVRWQQGHIGKVVEAIRQSGYGLTCGLHTRRTDLLDELTPQLPVGNLYINRNLIGAIPGVQPFGGEGLSGTGPKAGGPNYVKRFAVERCLSVDTTSAGGNTSLLMLND